MEVFEKMGKQGAGIEELLKQLLDEIVSNSSSLAHVEESMQELKSTADRSMKWIKTVGRRWRRHHHLCHRRRAHTLHHRGGRQ
jgi:hypothetical protein